MRFKSRIVLTAVVIFVLTAPIAMTLVMAATTARAYAYHPDVKAYGNVKKIVYIGRSLFEYKDDQGLSSVLPFDRQDKNVTVTFSNIVFKTELENTSIADGTDVASSAFTFTKDYLSSGDLDYIYLKMTNKSALSTDTDYNCYTKLITTERSITNDYYMLVTAKVKATGSNIARYHVGVIFRFKDEGANIRLLAVMVKGDGTGDQINAYSNYLGTGYDEVEYMSKGHVDTYYTVQIKIQDLLDAKSKNWKLSKLVGVWYLINLGTGSTLDASSQVEGWIRHGIVSSGGKIYIDDGTTKSLVINGTSGSLPYSAGDVLNIYGANATKIVDVTVPFVLEDEDYEITTIPSSNGFQYKWKFILPKSPSSVGDTLTYSGTNITMRCWFDGSYIDSFYVQGVDKKSAVTSKKVAAAKTAAEEASAYWTYGCASSLVPGNQYDVELTVKDLPESVWMALTEAPGGWWNPSAWWYQILVYIEAFLSFLGVTVTWSKPYRVPKR